ncbi:MAG: SDR family NAD(P)-dependent oxidoreductase [Limnochordia bacterium]|jgi:NAD(P)-dependent dehydrogenase (short-subunit alcohol dehydrogenase family)
MKLIEQGGAGVRLAEQVAIVTGATSGIGKGIACLFAQEGAKVAVVGRNQARGEEVVGEIKTNGGQAIFIAADVTQEEDVANLIAGVIKQWGQIDIVVNNAGAGTNGTVVDTDLATWRHVCDANLTSAYLVSHYALPHMLARQSGVILNVASGAGLKGMPRNAAYCASKAGLVGLTKAMAVDHTPHGVRVNVLCPGAVDTPLWRQSIAEDPNPEQKLQSYYDSRLTPYLGSLDDMAQAALYLVSPEARYVTGAVLSVDGGFAVK